MSLTNRRERDQQRVSIVFNGLFCQEERWPKLQVVIFIRSFKVTITLDHSTTIIWVLTSRQLPEVFASPLSLSYSNNGLGFKMPFLSEQSSTPHLLDSRSLPQRYLRLLLEISLTRWLKRLNKVNWVLNFFLC